MEPSRHPPQSPHRHLQNQKDPPITKKPQSFLKTTSSPPDNTNNPRPVTIFQLFRYTTLRQRIYISIAFLAATIHGCLLPLFTTVFGSIINAFAVTNSASTLVDDIGSLAIWFIILGLIAFLSSTIQLHLQLLVAQQTCAHIRRRFFSSLLTQDYIWLSETDTIQLTTRIATDVDLIQTAIGDKLVVAIQSFSTFVAGVLIAFVHGPLLTLVILTVAPLLAVSGIVLGRRAADNAGDGLGAYAQAGAVANEVFALIRTVTAYNAQNSEIIRYEQEIDKAYNAKVKMTLYNALALAFTKFAVFCTYAIAFAFGSFQVRRNNMDTGDILTTFFSIIIAFLAAGQIVPSINALNIAQAAAPHIFEVIERQSDINPLDEDTGDIIQNFKGHISFSHVSFAYKSYNEVTSYQQQTKKNPDVTTSEDSSSLSSTSPTTIDDGEDCQYVLDNFNLDVPPGTAHALVGPSGCGKSTTVRLIERFYDVQHGSVTMDGVDVRTLNVRWLRSQMGYVGQMPTLFMLSIRDNIALGAAMEQVSDEKSGKVVLRRKEVTDDDIIAAAKMANAHDFIMRLPEQYDTMLGERGALLSGGQKQRVCIARALIRNPRILILDESTAALDAQSERLVQEALEKASSGRTTITIAHRLSTVKNADVISVIEKGTIVEAGNHHELMGREDGAYRTLVENQNIEALKVQEMSEGRKEDDDKGEGDEAQVFKDSETKTQKVGEGVEEESGESAVSKGIWKRAFRMNRSEIPYILFGVICAALSGSCFPMVSIFYSDLIQEILILNRVSEVRRLCLLLFATGVTSFCSNFLQNLLLGISGERLTKRVRGLVFKHLLKQEIGFFDRKENTLGVLTTTLATDTAQIHGLTGNALGVSFQIVGSIATGFLISYLSCWRIALVVSGVFPLMAISGALRLKIMTNFDVDADKKFMQAGAVASEAVGNLDTITSIGVQDIFINRYNEELEAPIKKGQRTAFLAGVAYGASEFFFQALWAICFWVGAIFLRDQYCSFDGLMKAISGILFAGLIVGQELPRMADLSKGKLSATKIFGLLDRESRIDSTGSGLHECNTETLGDVKLDKVHFEYPSRPDIAVLRNMNIAVAPGKTLALVGASGCGKSTVVAMLQRFYDPRNGRVMIDDTDIRDKDVRDVRKDISIVSQEPELFNRSVRDNIAYGLSHEMGTTVTDEMIIQAAKKAHAHTFIKKMNDGYDTLVGSRGNKLSGGQRQRVAIARALVGQPRILLLDEATSALDGESEGVVQRALDQARDGRTTVMIAHRLSTVKNADAIAVVHDGRVVEIGRHEDLLRVKNGAYAKLVKHQLGDDDDDDIWT